MEHSPEFIAPEHEMTAEAKDLQEQFLQAIHQGDAKKINTIRQDYLDRYPDQQEGVTALFELNEFFATEKKLEQRGAPPRDQLKNIEAQTQFRFLLTHLLLENRNNPEWLKTFWQAAEGVARWGNNQGSMRQLRSSTLSQIAVMRVLELLGKEAKLSHPKEDAFEAVDLWTDDHQAIQIKGAGKVDQPVVAETDTIVFPAIQSGDQVYNSNLAHEFDRFKMKLKNYGRKTNEHLHGYMIVVPYSQFNNVTGEPSADFVTAMQQKIAPGEQSAVA